MALDVAVLRELLRNLRAFQAVYEADRVDVIIGPTGDEFCLWDLEFLYEQRVHLPPRQRQAIELCLVANIKESDAATMMGVSPTNPVAMYATAGLEKLVKLVEDGTLRERMARVLAEPVVPTRRVPKVGRVFCRRCPDFAVGYTGRDQFVAAIYALRAHTCEEVSVA